jgi:putative transposase
LEHKSSLNIRLVQLTQPDNRPRGTSKSRMQGLSYPRLLDRICSKLRYSMAFPRQHRTKLHSTNPIKRLNKEVKRRADVVDLFYID